MELPEFDEDKTESLFRSIYGGRTTPSNLPVWLYETIGQHLTDGVITGMGKPDPNSVLLKDLTGNVYYFSGAKTFQQVAHMQELLKDANGLRVPFQEFKKEANKVFEQYNKQWLKTEYNTAVGQSQMAQQWADIMRDRDIRPNLTYRTTEDERVCPICAPLDGFTAPVDSPIWNSIMPLNHYGCECTVSQEGPDAKLSEHEPDLEPIPKDFQFNPGKYKEVFDADHPYFDVPPQYEDLKAHNFNLPVPKQTVIEAAPPPPPAIKEIPFAPATTITDATKYATEKLGMKVVDYNGVKLDVANALNKRIAATKSVMPEIRTKALGTIQDMNRKIRAEITEAFTKTEKYNEWVERYGQKLADKYAARAAGDYIKKAPNGVIAWSTKRTSALDGYTKTPLDISKFTGIWINENSATTLGELDKIVKNASERKWFTTGATKGEYILNHEIGHEIDGTLNFRNTDEFKAIFAREHSHGIKYVEDRLSTYGATAGANPKGRPAEMIAEAWAEYVNSQTPRELAKEIGDLMLKEYYEKYIQGTGTTLLKWKEQALEILRANN